MGYIEEADGALWREW